METGQATPKVVVVGAGPAGLAVAAELRRRGLAAVVLERGDALGARWRSRYQGLRLNTYRAFSRLPGMPLPREVGRYASRDAFIAYLDEYGRRFGLDVRLGVQAQRIDQHPDGAWAVSTSADTYMTRHVVVATGWDAEPNLPSWATEPSFDGQLKHASQVQDPSTFASRRVLLAGAGNTGIDLAGLLVRAGAEVTVSMRTPPNIFPRDWLGLPLGPTVLISEHLPAGPIDLLGRFIQWQVYGNLSAYGIPRAPEGFMARFRRAGSNPAVDDGFINALNSGRARIVGEIERGTGVRGQLTPETVANTEVHILTVPRDSVVAPAPCRGRIVAFDQPGSQNRDRVGQLRSSFAPTAPAPLRISAYCHGTAW